MYSTIKLNKELSIFLGPEIKKRYEYFITLYKIICKMEAPCSEKEQKIDYLLKECPFLNVYSGKMTENDFLQKQKEGVYLQKFTIKTSYSIETYYCEDIEIFLSETCFGEKYEVIKKESIDIPTATLFSLYIKKLETLHVVLDNHVKNHVLMLLSGYYETFDEMLGDM